MKKDNNSPEVKNWTTSKLKSEAKTLHQQIHEVECYGKYELFTLDAVYAELDKRGITMSFNLTFNK